MNDLSLHILDILQNSVSARSSRITLSITEDAEQDLLVIIVQDNGRGMTPEQLKMVADPFFTTRTTRRVGMGIPLFRQTAIESGGDLIIESSQGKGTLLTAKFKLSHIDRPPLGDFANVFILTAASNLEIQFIFYYIYNSVEFKFDSEEAKDMLGDVPLNNPQVMRLLTDYINNSVKELKILEN